MTTTEQGRERERGVKKERTNASNEKESTSANAIEIPLHTCWPWYPTPLLCSLLTYVGSIWLVQYVPPTISTILCQRSGFSTTNAIFALGFYLFWNCLCCSKWAFPCMVCLRLFRGWCIIEVFCGIFAVTKLKYFGNIYKMNRFVLLVREQIDANNTQCWSSVLIELFTLST